MLTQHRPREAWGGETAETQSLKREETVICFCNTASQDGSESREGLSQPSLQIHHIAIFFFLSSPRADSKACYRAEHIHNNEP